MSTSNFFHPARRLTLGIAAAAGMLLSVGCAVSQPVPSSSLAAAQQAITNAERSGAQQYAGAELADARLRLQMAEAAVRDEDLIAARRLADESKITAELASATTETSKVLQSNQELSRGVQALIEETQSGGGQQ